MSVTGIPNKRTPAPGTRRPADAEGKKSIGYAVLGGGPAGLTGAYALGLREQPAVVFGE